MAKARAWTAVLLLCLLGGWSRAPQSAAATSATAVGTLDGTFAVNANGAASYTIDVDVPPGTFGVQPRLSLAYDSQSVDGVLGVGFVLTGLTSITRCGASRKLDGFDGGVTFGPNDRFCLDGTRLVKVAGGGAYGAAGSVYHTNIETWTKVTAHGSCGTGPCSFIAWNKDGWKLEIGATADSRAAVPNRAEIATWQIARSTDLHGNSVDVTYLRAPNALQNLPAVVRYTANAAAGLAASRRVELGYEPRTDVLPRYAGGVRFEQSQRLRSIRTLVGDENVFEYRLQYETSSGTRRSLLTSVTKCAADGSCLPPTTFARQKETNGIASPNSSADGRLRTGWCAEETALVSWMDFNGDGRTDVHCSTPAGAQRVLLSTGTSLVSPNSSADGTLRTNWCGAEGFVARWLDFDGDGRSDVACDGGDGSHRVLLSTGTALVSPNASSDGLVKTGWCAGDASFPQWTNFNADGRADVACRGEDGVQRVLLSTGTALATPNSSADGVVRTGWCGGSDAFVWWADFNGDRLADAHCSTQSGTQQVLLSDAETLVSPNSDPAGTVRTNWCGGSDRTAGGADFNGDGLTDSTCSSASGSQWVLLATGATLVSPNSSADGLVRSSWCANGAVSWSDFNGDARADAQCSDPSGRQLVLVSNGTTVVSPNSSAEGTVRTNWCAAGATAWIDFNGDALGDVSCRDGGTQSALVHDRGFPDLVTSITDGLGLTAQIEYAPLTESGVYTKGAAAEAWPLLDVQTPLYVVRRYALLDGRGATYRYAYRYAGARTDLEAGQWLGFEHVVMTEEATGRRNETSYLQQYPLAAFVSGTAVYDANGIVLARTVFTPKVVETFPNVFQVLVEAEQSSTYTAGAPDFINHKRSEFDRYGNPTFVADWNEGTPSDAVYSCFRYSNDEQQWRLGYVTESKVTRTEEACSDFSGWNAATDLRWGRTLYDDAGNPAEEWAWDDRNALWLKTVRTFDAAGNAVTVTPPSGGTTAYTFDDDLTFARTELTPPNAAGVRMQTTFEWSAKFGVPLAITDPNGNVQRQVVDAFGRTIELYGPDPAASSGAAAVLLSTVEYGRDATGHFIRRRDRQTWADGATANWGWSATWIDGMARMFRQQQLAGDGKVVTIDTGYDAAGREGRQSFPYFSGASPSFITTEYDLLNRPTLVVQPNGVKLRNEYLRGTLRVRTTAAWDTPEARVTVVESDERENVLRVESADGGVATYEYDVMSQQLRAVRPNGSVTTFAYDSLGRVTHTADTDAGPTESTYAATGLLVGLTNGAGNVTTFTYDLLARVLRRTSTPPSGAALTYSYTYDDPAAANARLQVTAIEGPGYRQDYAYTRYRDVSTEKLTLDGRVYRDIVAYDPAGRPVERTFFDGSRLRSTWSKSGDLLALDLQDRGTGPFVRYAEYTGYDAASQPLGIAFGNGLRSDYTYFTPAEGVMRLRTATLKRSDAAVATAAFQWNAHDQIIDIERTRPGQPAEQLTYAHDSMGWLVRATGPWGIETYVYDRSGNMTGRNGAAFTLEASSDRLASTSGGTTFAYDGAGNLTRRVNAAADWRYDWNASAQLDAVRRDDGVVLRNVYDETGRRLKRIDADGSISRYITEDADLFESGGTLLLTKTLRGVNGAVLATITTPYTPEGLDALLARGGAASLADALLSVAKHGASLLALGLLFALAIALRVARTEWTRAHPHFAAGVPLLIAALALFAAAPPLHAQLGPGDGNPGPGIRYFHSDQVTSVVLVTGADGSERTRLSYLPYGAIDGGRSSGPNDFRPKFTTKEWDHGSELYAFGSRYYDPATARFLEPDPQDQFYSRYMYGGGDPAGVIDRDGELAQVIAIIVVGAIAGAYFGGVSATGSFNPAAWEWSSARTFAGIFTGAVLGAASGALGAFGGAAGVAIGIVGDAVIGGIEGAVFTALGGGSQQEIVSSAILGAGLGALTAGMFSGGGAAAGTAMRSSRMARRGASDAVQVADGADAILPGSTPCGSFAAGTLVAGGDGTLRPIETIVAGDALLGFDAASGTARPFEVTGTVAREVEAIVAIEAGATTVEATPEHPFFTASRGWVEASSLRPGDALVTAGGASVEVTRVRKEKKRARVHNVSVATARTFFATKQRFLAHNQVIRCLLSKLPAPKSYRGRKLADFQNKIQSYVSKYGDREIGYEVLKNRRRRMDFENYALEIDAKKAVVDLEEMFSKQLSTREQHYAFGDEVMTSIFGFKFHHTGVYKWKDVFSLGSWHHHPKSRSIAFVPRDMHGGIGHNNGFSEKYVKPFQRLKD